MFLASPHRFDIERLNELWRSKEQETLGLEFKPCNELKVGTKFRDKKDETRDRQLEDVLTELTKDVTAFLNSAGGTLIYGILEDRKSRAKGLDSENAFNASDKESNIRAEKVIDWLRAHIQPSPMVDAYPVFLNSDDESSWYLVLDIEQGQQAYQAKDHRFYKRIGSTVQPMEQYEVVDVMNRTRAAALRLRVIDFQQASERNPVWSQPSFGIAVTSTNYVASEHGALKLTLVYPLHFLSDQLPRVEGFDFMKHWTALNLREEVAHAQSVMIRWGAHRGKVVFPGDWFDFHGFRFGILAPSPDIVPDPIYLFQTEVFTINSIKRTDLYAIRKEEKGDGFQLVEIDSSDRDKWEASFWPTYHKAWETLKEMKKSDRLGQYEGRVTEYGHIGR